jgi:WD40 repeat protein
VRPAVVAVLLLLLLLVAAALAPVATAADGSVAPRLAWRTGGWDIDFSPDGRLVAVINANLLQVRQAVTGEFVAEAAVVPYELFSGMYLEPAAVGWSPAGDRIAVMVANTGPYKPLVSLLTWDGADLRIEGNLTMKGSNHADFAWSPEGRRIVTGAYVYSVPSDPAHIQEPMRVWDAATRTVVATLAWDRSGEFVGERNLYDTGWMAWDPTGDVLFFAYRFRGWTYYGLAAWDFRTGGVVWHRDDAKVNGIVDLSPDGTRLAYTDRTVLYIANASTGEVLARRAANDYGLDGSFTPGVAWSSDGGVLYVANRPVKGVLLAYPSLDRLAVLAPPTDTTDTVAAEHATFSPDDRLLALGWIGGTVYMFDLAPPPPVLLIGGLLAVAGGGAVAVGYGWRRRRRDGTPEEGEP